MTRSRRQYLRLTGIAGTAVIANVVGSSATNGESGAKSTARITNQAQTLEQDAIFRGNLQRHGYFPDEKLPESLDRQWRLDGVNKSNYGAAKSSPVAAPTGDLIIAADTGSIYAVTPEGEVRWSAATDPSPSGIHGTPVIADGTVYVGAYDGALYAFDVETGQRRWKTVVAGFIGSSPAYHDGTIYTAVEFGDPDGSVVAVDAKTGDLEWEATEPTSHPHSTLAIDTTADILAVGANDGYCYAWHFSDREFAWKFNTGRPIKGPVAIYDGAVFFGSWDYNVYRVGIDDGEEQWNRSFTTDSTVMSGPAIDTDAGRLYIGSNDNALYALDCESGEEQWRYETEGDVMGCPTVTAEHVVFGSNDTNVYVLDKESGEHVWDYNTSGHVSSTPLVRDGSFYLANRATESDSGGFYRFGAAE
ncbi:PQQ-binding-like beta-propeller repeat protein [Natrinema sp. 1APR25-10V2]|nr:PQQ-binding-like beta-propeller repeat protein [Natrinema sp. 1APR25-10V2]